MRAHRGDDLVGCVEELLVDVADARQDRRDGSQFGGDAVELGVALTDDLGNGTHVLAGRGVVGVAVL